MDQPKPAEILFGAYRRQVLALLLLRPDERFHVRGIARLTGIPVILSAAEFDKKYASDPFLQRVGKETKIYVMGGVDDFTKLVGDRTA